MHRLYWSYGLFYLSFALVIANWPTGGASLIAEYGHFLFVGLLGAIVANCTGAGGGVLFIPFFSAIGFPSWQSVGTSMAIQCFGMTAGAVSWLGDIRRNESAYHADIQLIKRLLLVVSVSTIIGMLLGQHALPFAPDISSMFRGFSITFGIVLLIYTLRVRNKEVSLLRSLSVSEYLAIGAVCLVGAVVTSWISVGVGEALALLLFFLGFSAKLAVSLSVVASALAVLSGVVFHVLVTNAISIEVLLFAAQGAVIGGYIARHLTLWLGGFYLKILFSIWILFTGLLME